MSCRLPTEAIASDTLQHQVCHGDSNMSLATLRQRFVVLAVPPVAAEPSECPFHHPASRQDFKPDRIGGSADNLQDPTTPILCKRSVYPGVGRV